MTDYPHVDSNKPLMVVVDTSVFLHKLDHSIQIEHTDPRFEEVLKANLVWLMSGAWLGEDLRPLMQSMVFVKDTKDSGLAYWRTHWLRDLRNMVDVPRKKRSILATKRLADLTEAVRPLVDKEPSEMSESELETHKLAVKSLAVYYKAGRSLPQARFKKIRKLIYTYLDDLVARTLEATSYEADDMAASLVAVNTANGNPWNILLLTVDTDWLGLVNPNVTWCCMSGFFPTVRDTLDTCNIWAEKKLGVSLSTWREIWDVKGDKGDASDALPPSQGKLLPVIDLLNPPLEYRYWLRAFERISKLFEPRPARFSLEKARLAQGYLVNSGLTPVVKYLPGANSQPKVDPVTSEPHPLSLDPLVELMATLQQPPTGVF